MAKTIFNRPAPFEKAREHFRNYTMGVLSHAAKEAAKTEMVWLSFPVASKPGVGVPAVMLGADFVLTFWQDSRGNVCARQSA